MTDFSQLVLPTARLVLRPLVPADAPAVYAMHADPVTLRYWSTPPWRDPALADELIARDQAAMAAGVDEAAAGDEEARGIGGERIGAGERGEEVGLEVHAFGTAHRGEGGEGGGEGGFDGAPGGFGVGVGRADGDDSGLAEVVGGGGNHRVAGDAAEFGEGGVECAGEGFVDADGCGEAGGAFESDRELDAAAGDGGEDEFADAGLEFRQFAWCLEDDFRLFAVDGGDFDGGLPGVGGGRSTAESGHGMHRGTGRGEGRQESDRVGWCGRSGPHEGVGFVMRPSLGGARL